MVNCIADDAMAILAAYNSPGVEIIGLTTIFGNVRTPQATANALYLRELAKREEVRPQLECRDHLLCLGNRWKRIDSIQWACAQLLMQVHCRQYVPECWGDSAG